MKEEFKLKKQDLKALKKKLENLDYVIYKVIHRINKILNEK